MKKIAWAAPVVAGLTVGIPVVAHAATDPSPTGSIGATSAALVKGVTGSPVAPAAPASTAEHPSGATAAPAAAPVKAAGTTVVTPAPAGSAEAYALRVGSIAAISHTKAVASSSGTSSTADPVEIGGKPLASQFGGTQTGAGSSHGALLDTGPGQPLRLAVTPWKATDTESASGSTASALSDVLALDLGDPATPLSARARVLQSRSDATWTPAASTGSSSSDGAIVDLGGPNGLNLDVLHSQTATSGQGSSYLLSINGNQIGSSGQVKGACALGIPSLLTLDCLTAGGGAAGALDTATSGVLTATVGSGSNSLPANLVDSSSSSGTTPVAGGAPPIGAGSGSAPSQSGTSGAGSAGSGTGAGTTGRGATAAGSGSALGSASGASASSGGLAFTGIDAIGLIAAAMTLSTAGGLIVMSSRRRLRPLA